MKKLIIILFLIFAIPAHAAGPLFSQGGTPDATDGTEALSGTSVSVPSGFTATTAGAEAKALTVNEVIYFKNNAAQPTLDTATAGIYAYSEGNRLGVYATDAHGNHVNLMARLAPEYSSESDPFLTQTGIREFTIAANTDIKLINTGVHKLFTVGSSAVAYSFTDGILDTGSIAAAKDYYVYLADQGSTFTIVVSENSTIPSGWTAANTKQIGGFHTLCVSVGTIASHALTDYVAGDILPDSVWDLGHRPVSSSAGMVFSSKADLWVDIYLQSGTGDSTASVYTVTITDTRVWYDHVDDFASVKKRLLRDWEFQVIAAGSNEETNISGSADPVTTGGHSDTAGRRMISDIGVEDAAGAMWQWLDEQSYRYDGGDHTHTQTITYKAVATGYTVSKDQAESTLNAVLGSGADETITGNSTDPLPTWAWYDLPGAKGSLYRHGTYGSVKLRAGGAWDNGPWAGSRGRQMYSWPWTSNTIIAGRGCAEPR